MKPIRVYDMDEAEQQLVGRVVHLTIADLDRQAVKRGPAMVRAQCIGLVVGIQKWMQENFGPQDTFEIFDDAAQLALEPVLPKGNP